MKKKTINLGRVGFAPKGAYSPEVTYGRMHVVTYKNTTYWSKQEDNLNHEPNGEDDWWGVLVDGQAAYSGASNATQAADRANTAASTAEQTNTTVTEAEGARATAEQRRVDAETAREAEELLRKTAEQKRADAEKERIGAESSRQTEEQKRASAETMRISAEDTRKADEADRIADEKARVSAEESRVDAENERTRTEIEREANELTRKDNEAKRVDAEKQRSASEESRSAAESGRVTAENSRVTAENSRVSAEQTREQSFTVKVGEVDTAINNCNTATQGAEKVDATITEANVLQVTDRNGTQKTLDLAAVAKANAVTEDVNRIKESMGAYSDRPDITLTAKENNVAISADGVKVSKSGWAIAEFTAELGNIYLFNPGETSSDVCVFAEYIDKQETRAIDYAYTYDENGRVLTAKATYNGKTYTYTYDYSSSITAITDKDGNSVTSLPSVYTTTVGAYQPMTILNADAELPEDGYCRFVSNFTTASAIKIVVSYKVASADLTMKVVRDGSTANMCSQLAKINKKVDEVNGKVEKKNSLFIHVNDDGANVVLDNSTIPLYKNKSYTFKGFKTISFSGNRKAVNKIKLNWGGACPSNLSTLFSECSNITNIDVSGWDTSEVTSVANIFSNCANLTEVNLSGWDTSGIKTLNRMFAGCTKLSHVDLSGFDTSSNTSLNSFFNQANSVEEIDVSGFDTSKVTVINYVFFGCGKIKTLDLSNWDLSETQSCSYSFFGLHSVGTLSFGENFGKMKDECGTLDLSSLSAWKNDSVKSLLTLYDRKANGMGVITIKLHANAKAVLGEDGIEQLTAKGYTIA